ncbi:MAG: hemolysin family protein [Planctomycetota bacterium]|nr:hemolysin family protein [Planctomycetota bacterium]MEC9047508.1 hemolysin family protein [Planctomycetota bacterium]
MACAPETAPAFDGALTVDIGATIAPGYLALALAATVLGGYGATAAGSLIGYSPSRLAQMLEDQRRPDCEARTQELDQRDREYFLVATIYAAAGWVLGLWALERAFDPVSYPWALGAWFALMLFCAGSLPGAMADHRAERTVLRATPHLRAGWMLLRWPLVLPLHTFTKLVIRALRVQREAKSDPADVQKQVMAAVADNVDEAELADAERTWIGNIVTLKDQDVANVMTPRPDIMALDESISLGEAVDKALEHEFSRYPVYRDRLDEVVGIFYVKDAMRRMQEDPEALADTPLRDLLRDPLFVPETTGAAQLLRRIQSGNQHMAIVIDEYGTTVGLATVEDLVEEIVGEIEDEYDPPSSAQDGDQIQVVEPGRVLEIPARTSVQEINRILGSRLSDDGDWDTVAGLVIDSANRIPVSGETIAVSDVEFLVLAADERRVQRLRVTRVEAPTAEEAR